MMNAIREQIRSRIAEILGQPLDRLQNQSALADLVNSSFLLVELIIDLQDEFDVRFGQAEMQNVTTVGQLLDLYTSLTPIRDKLA
jgi:acyl carrier protein